MADYAPTAWVTLDLIALARLQNIETGVGNAVNKAPSTAQTVTPAADVCALTLLGRSGGTVSALDVESVEYAVVTKTANYTLTNRDTAVNFDCTSGALVATLPDSSTCSGRVYYIGKIDASVNTLTITPNGTDAINGAASLIIQFQNTVVTLMAVSGGWRRI